MHPRICDIEVHLVQHSVRAHLGSQWPNILDSQPDFLGYSLVLCEIVDSFLQYKKDSHVIWRCRLWESNGNPSAVPYCNCVYLMLCNQWVVTSDKNSNAGKSYFYCVVDRKFGTPCSFFQMPLREQSTVDPPYCSCSYCPRVCTLKVSKTIQTENTFVAAKRILVLAAHFLSGLTSCDKLKNHLLCLFC